MINIERYEQRSCIPRDVGQGLSKLTKEAIDLVMSKRRRRKRVQVNYHHMYNFKCMHCIGEENVTITTSEVTLLYAAFSD